MKRLLAALCVLTLSISAHAVSSLGYDFRADYQNLQFNREAGLPNAQRFYLKTGRLYLKGTLNERISYELRWGFYKPAVETATANSSRDSLNSSVEYANVTDHMSEVFALTVGKFNTEIGGLEGATSGADLYMVSPNYGHSAAVSISGTGAGRNLGINQSGASNLLYMTGVKGDFIITPDQHIYAVVANNVGDNVDSGGRFNQDRGLLGVIYKATFFEKAWTVLASYHEISPGATTAGAATDSSTKHSFASAGVRYDTSAIVTSVEVNATEFKDGVGIGGKDQLASVVGKFGYKMDSWIPRLEAFVSEELVGTPAAAGGATARDLKNNYTGYGAVVEYKPTADNFRYHVAYNSITSRPQFGPEQNRQEIVLGARLFGDFLK
ncbi:MAG: hypothetical protein EOP06_09725 [Proteobacteria bacterium]|nr:MAG: hypothetical protein EOP06_09725 [Pseudomonadota bacterium]